MNLFVSTQYLERGIAFFKQNRFAEAVADFDAALMYSPEDKYAHWNRATALLSLGRYEEGFKEHEWAWKLFNWRGFGPVQEDIDRISHLPLWEDEDISNQNLLVYHELGFGDGIQTLRYLPELKRRAGHVTLIINRELVRLAETFGVEVVDQVPADVSKYTYRLPLFAAMRVLQQTRENIPSAAYIPTELKPEKGHVGICWSGRTQTAFSLEYFLSQLDHSRFTLHSLQMGSPSDLFVEPLHARDFADTVELIAKMEHIVTIDSAPAHLAGATGHPSVHLLLPFFSDWRWWNTEVWYPTVKTYRQPNENDWATPFAQVNEALR